MILPVPPPREPEPPGEPRPPRSVKAAPRVVRVRPRSKLAAVLALGLLVYGAWVYFWHIPDGPPDTSNIHSVEVEFRAPWGEEEAAQPGARSDDQEVIAALATVLQKAHRTTDHKCGSRGVITLRREVGRPTELEFLAGHDLEWYQFRYGKKLYRVPRAEFVAVMRRIGVELPLECP